MIDEFARLCAFAVSKSSPLEAQIADIQRRICPLHRQRGLLSSCRPLEGKCTAGVCRSVSRDAGTQEVGTD